MFFTMHEENAVFVTADEASGGGVRVMLSAVTGFSLTFAIAVPHAGADHGS
jgi:hypothetical protein